MDRHELERLFADAINEVLVASSSVNKAIKTIFSNLNINETAPEEDKAFFKEASDFEESLLNLLGSLPDKYFETDENKGAEPFLDEDIDAYVDERLKGKPMGPMESNKKEAQRGYTLDEYWELPTPEELAKEIVEAEPEYPEPSSEEEITILLDAYSTIIDRAAGFNMYREQQQEGVGFNIKLRNVDLGEQAPNYNEANDEAFGQYLMEVYFPDQMEYAVSHIEEIFGGVVGKNDVMQLGRSGGHLVINVGKLNPLDDIGYGRNTITEDITEGFIDPANKIITGLEQVENYVNESLTNFGHNMSQEREFFESEYGSMEEEPEGILEEEEFLP